MVLTKSGVNILLSFAFHQGCVWSYLDTIKRDSCAIEFGGEDRDVVQYSMSPFMKPTHAIAVCQLRNVRAVAAHWLADRLTLIAW